MNHYLSVIFILLQQGKTEEAMQELQKRQLEVSQNQVIDTGYPVLNSLLSYKIQLAQEQQIKIQLFWNLSAPLQINLTDLSVILSNGLDNAIEAAGQVTATQPFVSLTAETEGLYIKVCICNNTATAPIIIDGKIATSKKNRHLHGLGLESIQVLARRYDGDSFPDYQDHIFTLDVILKNTPIDTED